MYMIAHTRARERVRAGAPGSLYVHTYTRARLSPWEHTKDQGIS